MTGPIGDPDPKNYFFCETCSSEEKPPARVVYPRRALKTRKAWFLDSDKTEKLTCPFGHDVVPEAVEAPAAS